MLVFVQEAEEFLYGPRARVERTGRKGFPKAARFCPQFLHEGEKIVQRTIMHAPAAPLSRELDEKGDAARHRADGRVPVGKTGEVARKEREIMFE